MDHDALDLQHQTYYSPFLKPINQQRPNIQEHNDMKPFFPDRDSIPSVMVNGNGNANGSGNGSYHPRDCVVSEASHPMNYLRHNWGNSRNSFLNMLPVSHNYPVLPEPSAGISLQILQPLTSSRDVIPAPRVEETPVKKEGGGKLKKRQTDSTPKTPKPKKPRKPKDNNVTVQRVKPPKKNIDLVINGIDMDISGIPIPVCSCTGGPHQCYRWGCGGWQSACCTTNISTYPLPMSEKRRGARIAGRKMSQGAFKKVLEKLAADGYNFSNPIDLKTHWARHGTNKFVTIR